MSRIHTYSTRRWGRRRIELGPSFQWIEEIWCRDGEALAKLRLPRESDEFDEYFLHPGVLDACFQLVAATVSTDETGGNVYIPVAVEELRVFGRRRGECGIMLRCIHSKRVKPREAFFADMCLFDETGQVIAQYRNLRVHVRRARR